MRAAKPSRTTSANRPPTPAPRVAGSHPAASPCRQARILGVSVRLTPPVVPHRELPDSTTAVPGTFRGDKHPRKGTRAMTAAGGGSKTGRIPTPWPPWRRTTACLPGESRRCTAPLNERERPAEPAPPATTIGSELTVLRAGPHNDATSRLEAMPSHSNRTPADGQKDPPLRSSPVAACVTCRTMRGTPTPARRAATTAHAAPGTATPPHRRDLPRRSHRSPVVLGVPLTAATASSRQLGALTRSGLGDR